MAQTEKVTHLDYLLDKPGSMLRWARDTETSIFMEWLRKVRDGYDRELRTSDIPTDVFRAQGAIEVCDKILNLPGKIRDNAKIQKGGG